MARQITVLLLKLQSSWIGERPKDGRAVWKKGRHFDLWPASFGTAVNVTITYDLSPSMLLGGIRK